MLSDSWENYHDYYLEVFTDAPVGSLVLVNSDDLRVTFIFTIEQHVSKPLEMTHPDVKIIINNDA